MKSSLHRFMAMALLSAPVAAMLMLNGCDSPVAPRFPEPIEGEDTITNDDEGATGRRTVGRMVASRDSLGHLILTPAESASSPTVRLHE